jgi:RNA 3'-terminal phosphate cyclase (ATP)
MVDRARGSLRDLGVPVDIKAKRVTGAGCGAGMFLLAEYAEVAASFSALGQLGKPSEDVADDAIAAFREHDASDAAVEWHLADQLLLPLALATGISNFTTPQATGHLMTNAWTIGQFGIADISIEQGTPCHVRVEPRPWR